MMTTTTVVKISSATMIMGMERGLVKQPEPLTKTFKIISLEIMGVKKLLSRVVQILIAVAAVNAHKTHRQVPAKEIAQMPNSNK
jgi:hypothetical protein